MRYGELEVGRLILREGEWEFVYSEAFKNQERVQVLLDFPRKNKTYRMNALWPFFASRIPGLEQPQIRERIRKEGIDDTDEGALLSRFGQRSIANPFTLVESR
ncbi:MAG: HipA N-terminal domain-containing protein [Opitutales bacterium]|nr:HipA N-terminal domain-containing protein [Opitutales bacterium]